MPHGLYILDLLLPGKRIPESSSDHYSDVITAAMACQITSFSIVYSTVYSGADQCYAKILISSYEFFKRGFLSYRIFAANYSKTRFETLPTSVDVT